MGESKVKRSRVGAAKVAAAGAASAPAFSAADGLRARLGVSLSVRLSTGEQLPLRRPNTASMLVRRVVTRDDVDTVVRVCAEAEAAAAGSVQRAGELILAGPHARLFLHFVNAWVCEAVALPGMRVVMEQQDASSTAMWVDDLPLMDRVAILQETLPTTSALGTVAK